MTTNEDNLYFHKLVVKIANEIYNSTRKENKMNNKGLTIRNLINSNKNISEVKLKIKQQVFQETFETDLGKYYTTKDASNETVLYECNIPLDTEVVQWFYNGTGFLTLTLNSECLGVKSC